ncbi:MAG: DNA primase [Candidatus Cloacimonadaceae bacterium]|nr:DNA primase [Candidatus Cloacimonadaceae bacterium]MDP3114045.1 DNA primase [Candidatus Cloacimonadaceae bacterium]
MDNNLIDQIRHANDIVEVVSGYLPLKRAGVNWRGICPFHQDTHPSMNVNQPKQIFKCFACGKAGNVFTFVQEYEHVTFMEAVKRLAARVGITIPEYERKKPESTKRDQLLKIYAATAAFFSENLFKHGEQVLKYLFDRSITSETAKTLGIGYALNSEKALLNHLMKEGFAVALLKESGLFGNYSGNLVDMFRDRLMFPIHNNIGEVIAFGGRELSGKDERKYVNSPGTELYTKGKELYGLFKTKYDIGKAGYSLVCEGYFDFLRLFETGFTNAVATLGTALTEDQIYLLNRYAQRVNMLYDGDDAGIRNAIRGALLCLAKGMDPHIVILPPKLDPDSFILQNGKDAMQELISGAQAIIGFMAGTDRIKIPVNERIDQLLDAIRGIKDPVRKELLIKDISEAFSISAAALSTKLRQSSRTPYQPEPEKAAPAQSGLPENNEERYLLILALKDKDSYNLLANELNTDYFNNRLYRDVFKHLVTNVSEKAIDDPATILDDIENKEIRDKIAEFLFEDLQMMRFEDALNQVKIRKLQRDLESIDRKIMSEPTDLELLKQKERLASQYRRMTRKVVHKILY